jgi:hypothetical protein
MKKIEADCVKTFVEKMAGFGYAAHVEISEKPNAELGTIEIGVDLKLKSVFFRDSKTSPLKYQDAAVSFLVSRSDSDSGEDSLQ